jgi:AcrR family transcriptional regulator
MVRKYENTNIRKKQLANAALRIIVKYGSEHITTKKIAEEVGISETAIYRHFKSKEELLAFLINEIEVTLLSEIELNTTANPYTLETLERTIKNHIEKVVQRKGISFQIIAEIISLGSKKLNKQVYGLISKYVERIEDIFEEGSKSGVIRPDIDLNAAANIFFGMTQGLVNTWALSQYKFDLKDKYLSAWTIFRNSILSK